MKKILSIVLIAIIVVSSFAAVADSSGVYTEVADDWALEYIGKADDRGITDRDTIYRYQEAINREDFCNMVCNYIVNIIKSPIPKAGNNFKDISSPNVNILYDMGIIKGKYEGVFAPDDLLTREEAATIIVRLVNSLMPVPVTEMYFAYDDEGDISDWASDNIQVISNMKVMEGSEDNKFYPKETLKVQEIITVLVRLSDVYYTNYSPDIGFSDKLNSCMPQDKNYMFSPLSIKMVLALAANGADGNTKEEITKTLGISNLEEFNDFSKELIEKYSKTEHLKLNVANSIWINSDNTKQVFSEKFKEIATNYYNADAKTVNNSNAVREINSWVNEKTNGKIPTVVNNSDFWASLINAIYFKGVWEDDFNEGATKGAEFTSADGTKLQIDFMNKTSWMKAYISDEVSAVELPYKNRFDKFTQDGQYTGRDVYDDLDVSMYLVMAQSDVCPESVLEDIVSGGKLKSTYTRFSMPKFKFDYNTSLNGILQSLGIKDAFSVKDADFTKMFNSGTMFISDTIHKTYISVDEKGTEAAAVTALMMAGSALPPEPVVLRFNKPFYFIIRDNTSGESLFIGRYAFA